jgi:Ca-activated chloride channel family protein
MLDADKMPYLKQSLAIFLRSLSPDDIVSIITYSDEATLLLPAQPVGDGYWIQSVIDEIEPGGCTNLHAGLMLGFEQVDRNFNIQRNNRVMLLTDGIANRGVTDPKKIAKDALSYNEKGIFLSTIGLGIEYNDALLMTLADQGKGGYSFIDSAKEMERVFSERAVTQKQCVAQDVIVSVIPDNGVRLIGITGFDGAPPSDGASITLWPLSIENSTVVLAQLQIGPGSTGTRGVARVRLEYFDTLARQTAIVEKVISGEMSSNLSGYDPTWDLEILRNVTIQNTAQGMRTISQMFDSGQYEAAWRIAVDLERQLMEAARLTGDQQLYDDAALMRRYQETLSDAVWHTEYRDPYLEDTEETQYESERPYRGGTDNPDLPEVDIK